VDVQELLIDVFGRVTEHVHEVLDGLDAAKLSTVVVAGSNPIGWLVWHLARVEDSQVAELAGTTQIWASGNWAQRFGLEPDPDNHGYGHTPDDVAAVQPQDVAALADYYAAVAEVTRGVLGRISVADLDRVVDDRWDPPVTMGVRLVSVADDQIQHAGQAAYLRGLLERR
jgi:uncharacterized damage-inducible protein DinB